MEEWRDIRGYEGLYQVSNFGRVKSFWFGKVKILKPGRDGQGYLQVHLCKGNKQKTFYVHRLVAEAFLPNPKNLPEVDHIDTDKLNNHVSNLRWATGEENRKYAAEKGLVKSGEEHPRAKLTNEQVLYIRENPDGLTRNQLAEKLGVHGAKISEIQLGRTHKSAGGSIRNPNHNHLPDEQRKEIRRLYVKGSHEFGAVALGKRFGVHRKTICNIIHEK